MTKQIGFLELRSKHLTNLIHVVVLRDSICLRYCVSNPGFKFQNILTKCAIRSQEDQIFRSKESNLFSGGTRSTIDETTNASTDTVVSYMSPAYLQWSHNKGIHSR
jgi:hypothetical protein